MKYVVIAAVLLACVGCRADSLSRTASTNHDVKVELLTEFDGIRLYRVEDGSERTVYVAVAADRLRTSFWRQEGKIQVPDGVETLR